MEPFAQLKAVPLGCNPFLPAPQAMVRSRSRGLSPFPARFLAATTAGVAGDSPGRWRHAGSFLWMVWCRLSTGAGGWARETVGNACISTHA